MKLMGSAFGVGWFGSGSIRNQPVSIEHSSWKQVSAAEAPRKMTKVGGSRKDTASLIFLGKDRSAELPR